MLQENADAVRGKTNIRIFVGADDGLLTWNSNYHEMLDKLDIENEWGVVPNSPHDLEVVMRNWQGNYFDFYKRVFGED